MTPRPPDPTVADLADHVPAAVLQHLTAIIQSAVLHACAAQVTLDPAYRARSLVDFCGDVMAARAGFAAVELLLHEVPGYDWPALLADAAMRVQAQRGAERGHG
jgi:hypothetical protein